MTLWYPQSRFELDFLKAGLGLSGKVPVGYRSNLGAGLGFLTTANTLEIGLSKIDYEEDDSAKLPVESFLEEGKGCVLVNLDTMESEYQAICTASKRICKVSLGISLFK